jgi:outer membrane protein OmpA-like peptidoglycan-associated protein
MVVPLVMLFLKKFTGDKGLNTSSLSSLLASQGSNLQGALDSRMSSALGFASPVALVNNLGSPAAETAKRAGAAIASGAAGSAAAAATSATQSGLTRWLPWVIGTAVVLLLWNQITGGSTPTLALLPTAAATAPATPVPAAAALPAKVYFEVGAATLGAEGSKTLSAVADLIKKDDLKVTVTGYTDRTGDLANNEALAKSRSIAVFDDLRAAGVADASLKLKPPIAVEVGAAGGDAEARRVEINKQ